MDVDMQRKEALAEPIPLSQPMDISESPQPSPPPPTRRRQLDQYSSDDEPPQAKPERYKSPVAKRRRGKDQGRMAKSKSLSDLVEMDERFEEPVQLHADDVLEERPKLRARLGNKWEDEQTPIIIERANLKARLALSLKKEEPPIVIPPVKSSLVKRCITVTSRKTSLRNEESETESTESESESDKEEVKTQVRTGMQGLWDVGARRKNSEERARNDE